MKKHFAVLSFLFLMVSVAGEAQYYRYHNPRPRIRYGRVYTRPPLVQQRITPQRGAPAPKSRPSFQPTVDFSAGYGFPNLDKNQLALFNNSYMGNTSQTGPANGAIDYRFSRNMSIGLLGTYGKVSAPYYSYNSDGTNPDFTGSLENWSLMLNIMSYLPAQGKTIEPYLRTAIGVNSWKQNYVDPMGNKAAIAADPSQLAYQVALGTKINMSKNAGLFVEAGYGKYILNGGLTLRF